MDRERIIDSLENLITNAEIDAVSDFGFWVLGHIHLSEDDRYAILKEMEKYGVDIPNDVW